MPVKGIVVMFYRNTVVPTPILMGNYRWEMKDSWSSKFNNAVPSKIYNSPYACAIAQIFYRHWQIFSFRRKYKNIVVCSMVELQLLWEPPHWISIQLCLYPQPNSGIKIVFSIHIVVFLNERKKFHDSRTLDSNKHTTQLQQFEVFSLLTGLHQK